MRSASLRRGKSSLEPTTGLREGATGCGRRCSPARRPVRYAVAHDAVHHRRRRPVGDRPHRRLGPAGRLLPDAARERLHPRAERGDHALRRLRRERGHHDPPRHHRRRGGRQPRRVLDRLRGRPLRRPAVHRQVRQVRAAPPPPRGARGALVRQVRARSPSSSAAAADRAHVHLAAGRHRAGCPSGSSRSTPLLGCIPWVLLLGWLGVTARRATGRRSAPTCTTPTTWWSPRWSSIVVWAVLRWRKGRRRGGEPDVTEYGDEA